MGPIFSMADFLDMLRRRVGVISAVIIAGCFGSLIWAVSVPHVYLSSEVIQIEQPQISDELANSTIESSAARRLQLIEQQLMAHDNLVKVIKQFGLYGDASKPGISEKVSLLREAITITGVAAVREGFSDDGAISILTITAKMDSAENAQAIAHLFADQTRALATTQRQLQTRETLAFFEEQERAVQAEIAALDAALADFRSANDISIEGSLDFSRSELGSLNDALLTLDREIISAELALENIDRSGNTRAATVKREEDELERLLASLGTQRQLLLDRRAALSASIETRPEVERTLAEFERRTTQLRERLSDIAIRRSEAEVGFTLESASRGERFTTLEEARVPEYPVSMSRKIRLLLGIAAATGLALIAAFLLELRRPVIRTARQMQRETGLLPVVSIPETRNPKKRKGIAKLWQDRSEAGLQGRAARQARHPANR